MRSFLASSIGVATVAALAFPLAATAARAAASAPAAAAEPAGSTQSLPLAPLPGADRSGARRLPRGPGATGGAAVLPGRRGLGQRAGRTARQRPGPHPGPRRRRLVRLAGPGDPQPRPRRRPGHRRGGAAPARLHRAAVGRRLGRRRGPGGRRTGRGRDRTRRRSPPVCAWISSTPAPGPAEAGRGREHPRRRRPPTVLPALDEAATRAEAAEVSGAGIEAADVARRRTAGPARTSGRGRASSPAGAGAPTSGCARSGFVYTKSVKVAFVHHTASGNGYSCAQAPSVLRSIYRYHVKSSGWRDIGYNFAVDKCGNIYEGRAGGVAKAVMGAHTLGFNTNSTGIAVLGTYNSDQPVGRRPQSHRTARRLEARTVRSEPGGQEHAGLGRRQPLQEGAQRQASTPSPVTATGSPPTARGRACTAGSARPASPRPTTRAGADRPHAHPDGLHTLAGREFRRTRDGIRRPAPAGSRDDR